MALERSHLTRGEEGQDLVQDEDSQILVAAHKPSVQIPALIYAVT